MTRPIVSLIAALSRNAVVGIENRLPWHLPEDLKYFKATTSGHPVLMGRKTYDSIGRPLPGRHNIVISRNAGWHAEGVSTASSLTAAIAAAGEVDELFVIGGATIYAEALALADRLYLTEIDAEVAGDAFFPTWPRQQFKEVSREAHTGADFAYAFVVYERIAGN